MQSARQDGRESVHKAGLNCPQGNRPYSRLHYRTALPARRPLEHPPSRTDIEGLPLRSDKLSRSDTMPPFKTVVVGSSTFSPTLSVWSSLGGRAQLMLVSKVSDEEPISILRMPVAL